MNAARPTQHPSGDTRRAGFAYRGLLLALGMILALPALAFSVLPNWPWGGEENGPMMHRVERGEFIHEVTERGSVESTSNKEIVCEVESGKSGGGVQIISIVDEGYVITEEDVADEKVLVELDSSALKNDLVQQQIICENSQAAVVTAENVLETAKISKQEYLEGTYPAEKQRLEIDLAEAEKNLDQLREYLLYSEKLARKGYISELQLQGDRTAVEQAENKLELAQKDLYVLENFTKEKKLGQLEADIKTAEAKLRAEDRSHDLDLERLNEIQEQIDACTICATETGQVVYANERRRRGEDIVIEPGTVVRERQVIIRLPDPSQMQVTAKVNESKISLIEEGMTASIRLDAFPEMKLEGEVENVSEYPAPTSWYNASVKEYETIVKITDPPSGLRPGLTAEVKIRVGHLEKALQVPVQAIIEHGKRYYCVLRDGSGLKPQPVKIGPTNEKFIVIEEGLEEGQQVVIDAAKYREEIGLPDIPPEAAGTGRLPLRQSAPEEKQQEAGEGDAEKTPGRPEGARNPARIFQELDKNGDGRVDDAEIADLPQGARSMLKQADTNGDGAIDRREFAAAAKKLMENRPSQGKAPPEGRP